MQYVTFGNRVFLSTSLDQMTLHPRYLEWQFILMHISDSDGNKTFHSWVVLLIDNCCHMMNVHGSLCVDVKYWQIMRGEDENIKI